MVLWTENSDWTFKSIPVICVLPTILIPGGSPYRDPPWTQTPLDTDPLDIDPPEGRWDQTETPRRNIGPGSQTGCDIIQRPPWTDTCKNITFPKLCLRTVKILIDNHYKTIYGPLIRTALLTLNMQLSLVSIQNATVLFIFVRKRDILNSSVWV